MRNAIRFHAIWIAVCLATGSATAINAQTKSSGASNMSRSDQQFIEKAAQGGMAEVDLGKLAAQKATDPQVKQFAQRMVNDHSKANDKLTQVASSKNVALPNRLPSDAKQEHEKLDKLSGAQFDREYMRHMLADHKEDVRLFQSESQSAKDADVKQFASETLPTLEQHLQAAQTLSSSR